MNLAYKTKFSDFNPKEDYTTLTGHLIRAADDKGTKFAIWQRDVVAAMNNKTVIIPAEVMQEFQKTKLSGSREREAAIASEEVQIKTLPPFTWSPSKLATFETCPMKYAAEYVYKTVPYQETVHTIWGNRVHKEAELFFKGTPGTDAEAFAPVKPYCDLLGKLPGKRLVEYRIGFDANWKPIAVPPENKPWEWGNTVGRMAVDLAIVDGTTLRGFDWKTGKQKDDNTQLQINTLCLAMLHPEVQEFDLRYVWLKDKKTTGFKLTRKELLPVYKDIKSRVARMKDAHESETFVSRRQGLCKSYCGAYDCPFCGGKK